MFKNKIGLNKLDENHQLSPTQTATKVYPF